MHYVKHFETYSRQLMQTVVKTAVISIEAAVTITVRIAGQTMVRYLPNYRSAGSRKEPGAYFIPEHAHPLWESKPQRSHQAKNSPVQ